MRDKQVKDIVPGRKSGGMMAWSFIKTYAFAACFSLMLIVVFGVMFVGHPNSLPIQPAKDCLPGYDELYFGNGAYACQRSYDAVSI
jgi:hypothetical protein